MSVLIREHWIGARLLLAALGPGLTGIAGELSAAQGHHPRNVACVDCHLAGPDAAPGNAQQLFASQEALCGRCHEHALTVSHPTGFNPRRELPAEYPLDWKGDITCSSCHDLRSRSDAMIRGTRRGRDLCFACHKQRFFSAMADEGASIESTGHLDARTRSADLDLDRYSLQCLGCHSDKSDARSVSLDPRGLVRHGPRSLNHPIGVRYTEAAQFGGYRPASQLKHNVLLPQGKVGCVSCHAGYSRDHGNLVVNNQRSALCFDCHDL